MVSPCRPDTAGSTPAASMRGMMSKRTQQGDLFMHNRRRPILCRCKSCKRGLSDPESVAREIGPECWAKGGGERYQIMMDLEARQ